MSLLRPDGAAWHRFLDHLFIWLGGLALAFAVLFFVAYNWNELGTITRFALIQVLIIAAIVGYWKLGTQKLAGKVSLLVASILVGVLLALYGQTYQTGADPWQLFFTWAMLVLPWALIGCFPAIWVMWVILINLSIVLYHQAFSGAFSVLFSPFTNMLWLLFAFNIVVLLLWELAIHRWARLNERWALRLVAVFAGLVITWLVLYDIVQYKDSQVYPGLVWIGWIAAMLFVYLRVVRDLFMLAGICLSAIVVVMVFVSRHLFNGDEAAAFLILAVMIIGMGAGAAVWLRHVYRGWQT